MLRHGEARVQGVRLHYVEAGAGPLVVFLHGFPQSHYMWKAQLPALAAAGFRVVAPDQRGYGESEKPAAIAAYRTEVLADDVAGLIRHLGADRASVVAHDWGGGAAWLFAMRHPELLDRLVIMNSPHPVRFLRALRSPRQAARSWYMLFFQLPRLPEALFRARNFAALREVFRTEPLHPYPEQDIERFVESAARPGALRGMMNWYRALRYAVAAGERAYRRVDAPVLVLWGDHDRYLGRELAELDPEWVPNGRVEHFPEATHWLPHDLAELVNERLVAFLSPSGALDATTTTA